MKHKIAFLILTLFLLSPVMTFAHGDSHPEQKDTSTHNRGSGFISIERFYSGIQSRFEAAIVRLENIHARITSRLEKIEANSSKNMEARSYLTQAKEHLTNAKEILSTIPSYVDAALRTNTASTTQESMYAIRLQFHNAKEEIKSAHRSLSEAISLIKKGQLLKAATSSQTR